MNKWIPFWAIPTLMLFAIGTVWLRLAIIRMTYAINEKDYEIAKSRQEKELIQIKLAALKSPKRLEFLAHSRFNLRPPLMEQIVHFNNDPIRTESHF